MKKVGRVIGFIFIIIFGGTALGIGVGVLVLNLRGNTSTITVPEEALSLPEQSAVTEPLTDVVAEPTPEPTIVLGNLILGKWRWGLVEGLESGVAFSEGYIIAWDGDSGFIEFYSDGTFDNVTTHGVSVSGTYRVEDNTIIANQQGITMREVVTIINNDSFTSVSDLSSSTYYYEKIE